MGEQIRFGGFNFTILEVEDNRRVVLISAKRRSAQKGQKSDQMRDSNVSDQNGGSDDREGPNEDRYSGEEDENSTNDLAKDNIDPTGKDTVNSEHAVDHSYDARSDWSSDRTTEDRTKEDMPWSSRLQEEIWVSSNNQTFSARERGKDGVTWIFNDGEWIPSRSADVAIADEPERSSSEDTREDGDSNKNMSNNIEVSSNSSKIIGRNNNN